jgi:hypothetical protein
MEYDNYIIYSYSCELLILEPGGGANAGGMMACLLIDRALSTGGSHVVSINCPSKFAAALMLS